MQMISTEILGTCNLRLLLLLDSAVSLRVAAACEGFRQRYTKLLSMHPPLSQKNVG